MKALQRFARLRLGISPVALAAALVGGFVVLSTVDGPAPAIAQSHGQGGQGPGSGGGHDDGHDDHGDGHEPGGGGGHSGGGGGGHSGGGGGGHSDGGHDDGHSDGGHDDGHSGGGGKGGAKGHSPIGGDQAGRGQSGRGDRSGLPVWAREGIPQVELGRLNVARSPDRVLDRAFAEAKATFSPATAAFYAQDLDGMIEDLSLHWGDVSIIDSPLQNLALFRDALDGRSVLRDAGITTDIRTLQAAFLGTASDKNIPITAETAVAVSAILGRQLSAAEAEALARDAEKVRVAILAGHG